LTPIEPATVVFLVNGAPQSAMDVRARSFEERLKTEFRISIGYRSSNKIRAIGQFLALLLRLQPEVCYVFDMGFSGVIAAGLYRLVSRCRCIIDTGDAIYELSRNSGDRGPLGLLLTKFLERFAFAIRDRLVVRSHAHQELLAKRGISATVVPDGVDLRQFSPQNNAQLRQKHGLEGFTVVGLLGSLIWNSRWQMCYGLELIETVDRLRDLPVKGVIVGDGSGLPELKKRCAAAGLEDRIVFLGRVPYDDLPGYINLMDVCLSTQTNDIAGQVRTTGKLPLYLACGRFVLASEVGEAARVLPEAMLVPYEGIKDEQYPSRLADRIRSLLQKPELLQQPAVSTGIARRHFDYDLLAARVRADLNALLPSRSGAPQVT
jgi:glycosyltransferase involved in cell wall biosynthesis